MLPRSAALDLAAPTSSVRIPHIAPALATALRRPSVTPRPVVCATGMQSAVSAPSEAQVSTSEFTHQVSRTSTASSVSMIGDLKRYCHAHCVLAGIKQRSQPSSCPHRADCCRASRWVSIPIKLAAPACCTSISDTCHTLSDQPYFEPSSLLMRLPNGNATGAMGAKWPACGTYSASTGSSSAASWWRCGGCSSWLPYPRQDPPQHPCNGI